jgi:hypothetical protein
VSFLSAQRPITVAFILICAFTVPLVAAQGARHTAPPSPVADSDSDHADSDHIKERNEWFFRGRLAAGKPTAELRRRAYQAKLQLRAQRAAALAAASQSKPQGSSIIWTPLGPVPLASDASGNGTQDYRRVAGRATAVAIDPADPTGNTLYVGGAQAGVWKSTNAASPFANGVTWTPITDDQATLSIGAIAIQPGNSNPAQSVILAATGEANNSADSYFGLGMLRSADAGTTWTLATTANSGALSFSGLGGTRIAFDTTTGQTNTVVAAMATSAEGMNDGAVTANTSRGLYTSLDAGQTWTYNALVDPGGATDATSATSVGYNASAGLFFAAIRYHGFYSSPDGVNWTRLATQPSGSLLSTSACPPQSTANNRACPIYRAEISIVPGRNEMYAWFVYFLSFGNVIDGGIWQSLNGGVSWTSISNTAIHNCGDSFGCGVEQGDYNLELQAVPNASGTDLYAGAINLFKCSINSQNPTCATAPFLNLTHVYGCSPIAAPAHVHPDQHALANMIPASGSDSGNALMYFANDGGIYRALDGFGGLNSGSCSGTNQFDDLNQTLGSMTQFVGFSQHPTDPNTLLGGTQDNGSPATNQATTNPGWSNVLGGDGGFNAIDPLAPTNFYASNPDSPPGGLGIQLCSSGVNCVERGFSFVATSGSVGGDDGDFYFPYILDPQSSSALLVGTCRVWRGSRTGGSYTVLSPNFDSLGSGTCSGSEINLVSSIAAGGPTDANGSQVIYATTSGRGPLTATTPAGGHVWVTTNATAGATSFADVTANGPQGSINPNQFPVSSVAIDPSDTTGATAFVTIMGFTGGTGHVWKTTNAGAAWTEFTANLPDAPVNAVVVDPTQPQVYVGTAVGVFSSSTSAANWIELGPVVAPGQAGFLPNVAVTALAIFNSGGEELLRASTYGRGIWQFGLAVTQDFRVSVSNSPLTVFSGQQGAFTGAVNAVNGYASSVALTCVAGMTNAPASCSVPQSPLSLPANTVFAVEAMDVSGDYNFNVQAVGSDTNHITHTIPLTLHVVSFALSTPTPATVTASRGTISPPASFQITAAGSFNQSVALVCSVGIANAVCTLTPGTTVNPIASNPVLVTASVTIPAGTAPGIYPVAIQATASGAPTVTASFQLNVTSNPDFVLVEPSAFPEVNAGSTGTGGPISISAQDGFSGTVTLNCPSTFGAGSCSISPATVSSFPIVVTLTINGTSFAPGSYSVAITGTSGSTTHSLSVPFNVGDYSISGTQAVTVSPGGRGTANLTLTSSHFYAGQITATCDASALTGATCTLSPIGPIALASDGTTNFSALIDVPNTAADGVYSVNINTHDATGAPSHGVIVTLTVAQDFLLTSSTLSQTVNAGQQTGPYNLTIQPIGDSFNSAVTLSCSGLPDLSACSFAPSSPVTPGNTAVNVVMTISTTASTTTQLAGGATPSTLYAVWLLLPGISVVCCAARPCARRSTRRKFVALASFPVLLLLMLTLLSCSGASIGGRKGQPGTPPGTYTIILTGTSPGAPADAGQSTQVKLVVH